MSAQPTYDRSHKAEALRVQATRLRWLAATPGHSVVAGNLRRLADMLDRLALRVRDGRR
jgi:hypothetical protein